LYDSIYIASNYGKNNLPNSFKNKVKVIPWGMDNFKAKVSNNKIYDVIFPHRLSPDKGIEEFIIIVNSLPQFKFVVTVPQREKIISLNKYYKILKKCHNVAFIFNEDMERHNVTLSSARIVLSCAKQEIFGYSVAKSVVSGCVPVLPNDQCYPEFYKKDYLYDNIQEAIFMIKDIVSKTKDNAILADCKNPCISNFESFSFKNHFDDFFG
jgi:glycosyltransferase involved in cell wall biosynthesis